MKSAAIHSLACCLGIALATITLAAPGDDQEPAPITYDDHVRPILREHCFTCHNQNDSRGGLALDSYARVIEGGSGGEVVFEGDLDSSRLWALVNHDEEPVMPPGQDKLADAKLRILRDWINGGLLENSGSTAKAPKKTLAVAAVTTTGRPEGPVAMPEDVPMEPVVVTARAAAVSALAASPWAPVAAVAGQEQIVLYHTDDGRLLGILPFPEGIPYVLRFSRDGSHLLAGGGRGGSLGIAALYDVKTGERLMTVGDELDAVLAADISPDLGRIALGGPGRIVRIYSTRTGNLVHEIRKHTDWIYALQYSPDGVLLATADRSNGLFVWEADTAREYLELRGHTDAVTDVAWRLDSNLLASASRDGTVRLWEMNDGNQVARADAHGGGTHSVAFAHDGRVATAGEDRTVKLWDGSLKPIKALPSLAEPALRVVFSHDGQHVIGGDWSGVVRMWQAESAEPIADLPPNPPRS